MWRIGPLLTRRSRPSWNKDIITQNNTCIPNVENDLNPLKNELDPIHYICVCRVWLGYSHLPGYIIRVKHVMSLFVSISDHIVSHDQKSRLTLYRPHPVVKPSTTLLRGILFTGSKYLEI